MDPIEKISMLSASEDENVGSAEAYADSLPSSQRPHQRLSRHVGICIKKLSRPLWLIVLLAGGATLSHLRAPRDVISSRNPQDECSALAFDAGQWRRRAVKTPVALRSMADITHYVFNVSACSADVLPSWNLGVQDLSPPFDSNRYSYEWQPHETCKLRQPSLLDKLQALVIGPVALNGDSRTRQHFFSISCELAGHVVWKSIPIAGVAEEPLLDGGKLKFQEQHLYLDPNSSLLPQLRLPRDFSYDHPLLSYFVSYWPLNVTELQQERDANGIDAPMVKDPLPLLKFQRSMHVPINWFTGEKSRYKTMLVSTGMHISPHEMQSGTAEICFVLSRLMIRRYLKELAIAMRPGQRVLVRAAPPGHAKCAEANGPTNEVPTADDPWNWASLPDWNHILEEETLLRKDSRFLWMGLERLSRMRPDSHPGGNDCGHFVVGSGVYETWTRYLWHNIL